MASLDTAYLGLALRSPIVASAGPLTGDPDTAARLADAGVGALVLPSLFEEEIIHEQVALTTALEAGAENFAEALDYFPAMAPFPTAPERYLANLERIRARVPVPVIASLNAFSPGGWVRYARLIAEAGADAIELNVYRVAADPARDAAAMEADDLALVADVSAAVDIPVAVKLSPFYSAMANFADRAVARRGRRARPVQPLLPARSRRRDAGDRAAPRAVVAMGAAPAVALDRRPAPDAAGPGQPRRHQRRRDRSGCGQGAARGRRRRDDHLGRAAPRPRARRASSRTSS